MKSNRLFPITAQCPGLGLFYSGLARSKNALSLMFLTMIAVSVVSIQVRMKTPTSSTFTFQTLHEFCNL